MEKLNEYFELLEKIKEVESILKDLKKLQRESEDSLVADAIDSGVEKMSLEDSNVKFSYENIISIAGGNKDTEQRRELLDILAGFGYSDGRKLNSILKEIDSEISKNLIEKKLINVYNKPVVKITKKRK